MWPTMEHETLDAEAIPQWALNEQAEIYETTGELISAEQIALGAR
jgi:hypothetical protein